MVKSTSIRATAFIWIPQTAYSLLADDDIGRQRLGWCQLGVHQGEIIIVHQVSTAPTSSPNRARANRRRIEIYGARKGESNGRKLPCVR